MKDDLSAKDEIRDLIEFIKKSPTAWHAGAAARHLFVKNGFIEIYENQECVLILGEKYFISRDISSFIAIVLPLDKPTSASILGAHTDSPGLKLKPNPIKSVDNTTLLCPETYGGLIIPSWMGRSLGLAGRIDYLDEQNERKNALIDLGKTIATIPYLAIHLERTQKDKVEINAQEHLPAVYWLNTGEGSLQFEEELKKIVPFKKLLSHELFLVPRELPEIMNDQFLNSQRLDNLLGTHASIYALLKSSNPEKTHLKIVVCWDHEEIGSSTYNGAASNFLESVLTFIADSTKMSFHELIQLKANSGLISVDAAHGRHPNYFGKHEPNHAPLLGHGPVIKTHANQNYSTTSPTAAWIKHAGILSSVPIQDFCIRSDTQCGSTIGNIAAPNLGIRSVDIGAPIWGMHAIRETGSLLDHVYMCELLKTLLSMGLN